MNLNGSVSPLLLRAETVAMLTPFPQKELRKEIGMEEYSKGETAGLFGALLSKLPGASQNAKKILAEAIADNEMNPSTRLHELMKILETLGQPQVE